MPLYEFFCEKCQESFEQITKKGESDYGKCPKCLTNYDSRLVPKFKVGGRGDLRESTLHGCHACQVNPAHRKTHKH